MWWLGGFAAWAAECNRPLTRPELEAIAESATAAIEADDSARFRERFRQAVVLVPCLEGPLPREPWARLLVLEAVVRVAEGTDPTPVLSTALRVHPGVSLPPFLKGKASAESLGDGPAPAQGARFWVDGQPSAHVPTLSGDHVFQREIGGRFESVYASAAPRGWAQARARAPDAQPDPRPVGSGVELRFASFGAAAGVERITQRPDENGDFAPRADVVSPSLVATGELRGGAGPGVIWGRANAPLRIGALSGAGVRIAPRAELGLAFPVAGIELEVGALLGATPTLQGGRNVPVFDPLPLVGVRGWAGAIDAGATVAAWADSARVRGALGWTLDASGPLKDALRVTVDAGWAGRRFRQRLADRDRRVGASGLEFLVGGSVRW